MFKVLITLAIIFFVFFLVVCLFDIICGTLAYFLGYEDKWLKAIYKAFKKF